MSDQRHRPIIIGVGDIINRSTKIEDALEPAELMLQAISTAIKDIGLNPSTEANLLSTIDSLDVVHTWTWPYPYLPNHLAQKLGINPAHKFYSELGGNQPAKLFDEAARRISKGESKVAVITGGEALASLASFAAAGKLPPPGWTKIDADIKSVFSPTSAGLGDDLGGIHGLGLPIHVYPLYENAFRAYQKQTIFENNQESADLYAQFAKTASQHPFSWTYGKTPATIEQIGTVSKKNRMICFPYPLLMNAFNSVNLAAAVVLTSTEHAEALGVPKEKWVYALGGAGTKEREKFWERPRFWESEAIGRSLDTALDVSGLKGEDVDFFDFYSCFPIVPKLACHHLGINPIGPEKPISLLGGLTSFGGAGNNYSMHAITEMARRLRSHEGRNGLVLANGGVLSYQHVICLSAEPRRDGSAYPTSNPLPQILEQEGPLIAVDPEGEAVVETYTVEFNRNGTPKTGFIVGRLKANGQRFIANHMDQSTLVQLASRVEESVGRSGWVKRESKRRGRNLFSFERKKGML